MTASVITALTVDMDNMLLGVTPFKVELKGKPEPRIRVEKIQDLNKGGFSVKVLAPADIALSTLDAIARRIVPGAKVYAGNKGGAVKVRLYS